VVVLDLDPGTLLSTAHQLLKRIKKTGQSSRAYSRTTVAIEGIWPKLPASVRPPQSPQSLGLPHHRHQGPCVCMWMGETRTLHKWKRRATVWARKSATKETHGEGQEKHRGGKRLNWVAGRERERERVNTLVHTHTHTHTRLTHAPQGYSIV
jgi:hypothetical protein